MSYSVTFDLLPADRYVRIGYRRAATVAVVGCGGTGSFLAEAVCRLLIGQPAQVFLVDMDVIEPHNVARQAFDKRDAGRAKSQVLAERLSSRFSRKIAYVVAPYSAHIHHEIFGNAMSRVCLLVGCVDNAPARRVITDSIERAVSYGPLDDGRVWWLDCGNGRNSGQILLGNRASAANLRGAFYAEQHLCTSLPAPSLQRPDLLTAPPQPEREIELDCAERVMAGDQGATINQVVAAHAASLIEKLLAGTCSSMSCYFDCDDGTLRHIPADPSVVARLIHKRPSFVLASKPRPARTAA